MHSSLRWTISVLVLSVLLIQLVAAASPDAYAGYKRSPHAHAIASPDGAAKRSPGDGMYGRGRRGKPRRNLNFPDTNKGKTVNKGDTPKNNVCKKWFGIRDVILRDVFQGTCGDLARAAVRLAFHDAGTFSLTLERQGKNNGGADGSLLIDPTEVNRNENNGLQPIVGALKGLAGRFGVSNADILHVAGILGVIICPGGPAVETWIGRKDAKRPNPTGLLPDTHDNVPNLIARMSDMGFTIQDSMALIGAHTTARQRFVDPAKSGMPLDSTIDIWDVKFYGETVNATRDDIFILPSDKAFAHHPLTADEFQGFVDDQDDWDRDYADAHEKMSLLGQDKRRLVKCTEILPPEIELGPLFVDKDSSEPTTIDMNNAKPGNTYSLKVDPARLRDILMKLRGYWGFN